MPARIVAASFGLIGFSATALIGLLAGNDHTNIIIRSLLVMIACWVIGRICGAISMVGVREYLTQYESEFPIPDDVDIDPKADADEVSSNASPAT